MENANGKDDDVVQPETAADSQNTFCESDRHNNSEDFDILQSQNIVLKDDSLGLDDSQNIFPESPVYEPDSDVIMIDEGGAKQISNDQENIKYDGGGNISKRKINIVEPEQSPKILKVVKPHDSDPFDSCDIEISNLTSANERTGLARSCQSPSMSRVQLPTRCSPRKITKRSNSCTTCCESVKPKQIRFRSNSIDQNKTKTARPLTPLRKKLKSKIIQISESSNGGCSSSNSRPSVEFVGEIRPPQASVVTIYEEGPEEPSSQDLKLQLSPTPDSIKNVDFNKKSNKSGYRSEPNLPRDRTEYLNGSKSNHTYSLGFKYSDEQPIISKYDDIFNSKHNIPTEDQSTDSVSSITLDSPNEKLSVAAKLINKLSNGNSSTPTDVLANKMSIDDTTPDSSKLHGKLTSLTRHSNNTTPSTISPLHNGHHTSFPTTTPNEPVFDIHIGHDEDGEFLSMYVVRTDLDQGLDMYKEFQRISRRFSMEPYLADISKSNSPSSVTSTGMFNLRTSFASTLSSTSSGSSNRTSDGAFIIPQAPIKNVPTPGSSTVKGYKNLWSKLMEIFAHVHDGHDTLRMMNSEEKISTSVQVSPGNLSEGTIKNGAASPEEISRNDRATPKSSLKKPRGRGRRPLTGKTKRAILPTQPEEQEYMHGMNSPEMIPRPEDLKMSPKKEADSSNGTIIGTPKSISKLKDKKKVATPRPATPLDKSFKLEQFYHPPGTVVLAKWIDKRYYSGRVKEMISPGKYVIDFDDGQSKTLLEEFIIFGDTKELPLNGQSVYAIVDEDQNYEPCLVLGIDYNSHGTVTYRCTTDGDSIVSVTASEMYLTEDQANSLKESQGPKSPLSSPSTPRRRGNRELDLDNIIHGPRSARSREKSNKKKINTPRSPKASTSGIRGRTATPNVGKKQRHASESSEMSEGSNSGFGLNLTLNRVEEVAGVEPEFQKTPRKIDGVKAGPLQLKGAAKQNPCKKNSKLNKFENDEDTITRLGPIPDKNSKLFVGLHFLLTCTDQPFRPKLDKEIKAYSSEEDCDRDGESTDRTDIEDLGFSSQPFNKERIKEQLETGGGIVYSHFEDVPKAKYSSCKLIAPRPCLTAKYIQCLAADIKTISHGWVILCCTENRLVDFDAYALPAGYSISRERFLDWTPSSTRRNTNIFKDKLIIICNENETFVKFWDRICSLAGANTRVINEDNINLSGGLAVLTEWDCAHEVQNKANQENIPLVSTTWVVQCLIENKLLSPTGHIKYSFMYTESE